jgi:hypothetical protein
MKYAAYLAVALSVGAPAFADETNRQFDGTWNTIVSCQNEQDALGYAFEFPSNVKDGVLHGEKGVKNTPGWLQIDGPIAADGTARLFADGLVGAAPYAVGHRPAGSQYGYHVDAKFTGQYGIGHRVEGRPCTVEFRKL